jgi:hypothetical protein
MRGPTSRRSFLPALAKDLKAHAGKSVVIPGLYQDSSVDALALAINNALGNVGKTVSYGDPSIARFRAIRWGI